MSDVLRGGQPRSVFSRCCMRYFPLRGAIACDGRPGRLAELMARPCLEGRLRAEMASVPPHIVVSDPWAGISA